MIKIVLGNGHLLSANHRRLFSCIADVFNIKFSDRQEGETSNASAWYYHDVCEKTLRELDNINKPVYACIKKDLLESCGASTTIDFEQNDLLKGALYGRQLQACEASAIMALPRALCNTEVLAKKDNKPIWVVKRCIGGLHHFVSVETPELSESCSLFSKFTGNRFLNLLPLIFFIIQLRIGQGWKPPDLQACFIIDDPNLHWKNYGFIDYAKIAKLAEELNYHVAFAMMPIDTWYEHKPTVSVFKKRSNRISILIHGNDHLKRELFRNESLLVIKKNLCQALSRIKKFEKRTGLQVSRVMAPPHGACSEDYFNQMNLLGFEAACVSKGSLVHYNPKSPWAKTIGLASSDFIMGLPVIQRFGLSKESFSQIIVSAILKQPIVLVGHHYDLRDNGATINEIAKYINSIGPVKWNNIGTISMHNYWHMQYNSTLKIKMFSNLIEAIVDDDIKRVMVYNKNIKNDSPEIFETDKIDTFKKIYYGNHTIHFSKMGTRKIRININASIEECGYRHGLAKKNVIAFGRRIITELRDRIKILY